MRHFWPSTQLKSSPFILYWECVTKSCWLMPAVRQSHIAPSLLSPKLRPMAPYSLYSALLLKRALLKCSVLYMELACHLGCSPRALMDIWLIVPSSSLRVVIFYLDLIYVALCWGDLCNRHREGGSCWRNKLSFCFTSVLTALIQISYTYMQCKVPIRWLFCNLSTFLNSPNYLVGVWNVYLCKLIRCFSKTQHC